MIRPGGLLLGLALAAPSLWDAIVAGTLPTEAALHRTLVALLLASLGWAAVSGLVASYADAAVRTRAERGEGADSAKTGPLRRAGDAAARDVAP